MKYTVTNNENSNDYADFGFSWTKFAFSSSWNLIKMRVRWLGEKEKLQKDKMNWREDNRAGIQSILEATKSVTHEKRKPPARHCRAKEERNPEDAILLASIGIKSARCLWNGSASEAAAGFKSSHLRDSKTMAQPKTGHSSHQGWQKTRLGFSLKGTGGSEGGYWKQVK